MANFIKSLISIYDISSLLWPYKNIFYHHLGNQTFPWVFRFLTTVKEITNFRNVLCCAKLLSVNDFHCKLLKVHVLMLIIIHLVFSYSPTPSLVLVSSVLISTKKENLSLLNWWLWCYYKKREMLHSQITIIGPKQRSIWREDRYACLILKVQSSLNVAATSLDDIYQVGRTMQTTFESVAI